MRVEGHGVSEGGDGAPALGRLFHEVVVGRVGEEGRVAVSGGIVAAVLFDVLLVLVGELGVEGGHDDHFGCAGRCFL